MPTKELTPLEHAFIWVLATEGGYVNDPNDHGGETKYGISKRQYPTLDIRDLTIEEAQEIYRVDYWDEHRCGELPIALGLFVFDAVVNHHPKTAVMFLQHSLGTKADGIIGPNTIRHALNSDIHATLIKMLTARANFYYSLITSDSSQAKFQNGWIARLFRLTSYIHFNNLIEA